MDTSSNIIPTIGIIANEVQNRKNLKALFLQIKQIKSEKSYEIEVKKW